MKKKELPVSLYPSEISWGFRYLLFQLFFLGSIISATLSLLWHDIQGLHINFLYFTVNFVVIIGIFHRFLFESVKCGMTHPVRLLIAISAGLGVYFTMTRGITLLIDHLMPGFQNANDFGIQQHIKQNLWLTGVGTVLLVPLAEETLYRGLLFGILHRKSRFLAYALSTLAFCAIHVSVSSDTSPLFITLSYLQYVPAGLTLAWAYEFSGSIIAPVFIHTIVNLIATISMR